METPRIKNYYDYEMESSDVPMYGEEIQCSVGKRRKSMYRFEMEGVDVLPIRLNDLAIYPEEPEDLDGTEEFGTIDYDEEA